MTESEEQEFFAIKSKFFREIPHPKLILKAIGQVEKLSSINVFSGQHNHNLVGLDLETALKQYTQRLFELKTCIAQSVDFRALKNVLDELYVLQMALIAKLQSYLPEKSSYPDEQIKQSASIDSHALLTFLRGSNLPENEIKTYICTEIESREPEKFSLITRACLQSRKIKINAGSDESLEGTVG